MSSETSSKSWSISKPRKRSSPPEIGHAAINCLGHDLLELGFEIGSDTLPRWATVGFTCGLRLANAEPAFARKLLRESGNGRQESLLAEMVLTQVGQRPLTASDELSKLRRVFTGLLNDPPAEIRKELNGLGPAQQFAWWFRHSVTWGIQAGLNADSLFTGRMLAFLERLPLNQRFISDRLIQILRAGEQPRRPALIELFHYSYPTTPIERTIIVERATAVLGKLTRKGMSLELSGWILYGFREGLLLSTRNASLRKRLFAEVTREGMRTARSLFAKYIGPDPARWHSQRLVRKAMAWLEKVHPTLQKTNCRTVELERIRHVFDFAFWMGLVAGAGEGSTR